MLKINLKYLLIIFSFIITYLPGYTNNGEHNYELSDSFYDEIIDEPETPKIIPYEGGIEISIAENQKMSFLIFSITGQLIKKIEIIGKANRIDLPKGCYIVKSGKWSKKMVVR